MKKYQVTVAHEVYHTFVIEAEFDEEPDTYKWNSAALRLRDLAFDKNPDEAISVDAEAIDFLEITEV
jgi:hypothetical protein